MRRDYAGAAQPAQLTQNLGNSTANTTIYCTDLTGWPTGAGSKPFYVVIDRGKASEEKILCASRSGDILTVYDDGVLNGRGADETSITAHSTNAVIEHVFTATDADEANQHVNATGAVHGLSGTIVGTTDTQTLTNKTLTTPTISSFTNAQHSHGNAAGGGNIAIAAVTGLQAALDAKSPLSVARNAQAGSYTLVADDAGKVVEMSGGGTLTVPLASSVAFADGTQITIVQTGSSQVTIAGASGVTVNSAGGYLKVASQWSAVTLIKRSASSGNVWVAVGALVA